MAQMAWESPQCLGGPEGPGRAQKGLGGPEWPGWAQRALAGPAGHKEVPKGPGWGTLFLVENGQYFFLKFTVFCGLLENITQILFKGKHFF